MAIGLDAAGEWSEVGRPDFFKSFFSTIALILENGKWGSRFPVVMRKLYLGEVPSRSLSQLEAEISRIREELNKFSPAEVVWDFEDPMKQPPWGTEVSPHITSLANYFWTSDGKDLFEVILRAAERAKASNTAVRVL